MRNGGAGRTDQAATVQPVSCVCVFLHVQHRTYVVRDVERTQNTSILLLCKIHRIDFNLYNSIGCDRSTVCSYMQINLIGTFCLATARQSDPCSFVRNNEIQIPQSSLGFSGDVQMEEMVPTIENEMKIKNYIIIIIVRCRGRGRVRSRVM